ncbi:MAG: hypothetical protein R3E34_15295 [Rhodocyclaceae bacterium]
MREGLAVDALVLIGSPGNFDRHLRPCRGGWGWGGERISLRGRLERRYLPIAQIDALQGLPVERTGRCSCTTRTTGRWTVQLLATLRDCWPGSEGHGDQGRPPSGAARAG